MTAAPSQIWINAPGKEPPAWVAEHMASGVIANDGTFDVTTPYGNVAVERGYAVFEYGGDAYACQTREIQDLLKRIAGPDHAVVTELAAKNEGLAAERQASKAKANILGDSYTLKIKPMIGEPPAPQFAAVDKLKVDDTYQRSIEGGASRKLVIKIAENWDWRLCLPLLVSRRNGEMFVIDGQHRKEAAELRGDIPHLPVVVFDFDDPKAEAELFVAANRSRRPMGKLDDFHAAVVAGDAKAIAINEVVAGAGLAIGRNQAWQYWKPGEVVFVTAIERALRVQGKPTVEAALGMIGRAFEGLVLTGVGSVFEGLCTILKEREAAGSPIDVSLMELVLSQVGIPGWKDAIEGAESGRDRMEMMQKALIASYEEAEAQ